MSTATAPASASEAMDMVHAGLAYLAAADASAMGPAERAGWLRGLEEADAVAIAARTSVLGAFAAGQDYVDDGDYSPCGWLIHRTHVTKGTAVDHTGWMKRGAGHPAVMAALAARKVSKSYAREICWWTDKLPEDSRAAADEILLGAAAAGLELADLGFRTTAMLHRRCSDHGDAPSSWLRRGRCRGLPGARGAGASAGAHSPGRAAGPGPWPRLLTVTPGRSAAVVDSLHGENRGLRGADGRGARRCCLPLCRGHA
jgi:hypothetical protein